PPAFRAAYCHRQCRRMSADRWRRRSARQRSPCDNSTWSLLLNEGFERRQVLADCVEVLRRTFSGLAIGGADLRRHHVSVLDIVEEQVGAELHRRLTTFGPERPRASLKVVVRRPTGRVRLAAVEHGAGNSPADIELLVCPGARLEPAAIDLSALEEPQKPIALRLRVVRLVPAGILPGSQTNAGNSLAPPVVAVVAPEVGHGAVAGGPGHPDLTLPRLTAGLAEDGQRQDVQIPF